MNHLEEEIMSAIAATPSQARSNLDIGLALKQGARLFFKDLGALIIAALIAGVLSIVTLGILAGPMFAGLYGMVIGRVRDGRQPKVDDVFAGFDRVWSYLGAALVLGLLVGLASITVVGGFALATIWLYVFPLMVDRGMGLGEAMKASKDLVMKVGFWEHLALVIVFFVIASVANGVLAILAVPFIIVAVTAAYYLADGKEEALARA
jgi:hypothetical protein